MQTATDDKKDQIGVSVNCDGAHFQIKRVDEMLSETLESLGTFSTRLLPQVRVCKYITLPVTDLSSLIHTLCVLVKKSFQ